MVTALLIEKSSSHVVGMHFFWIGKSGFKMYAQVKSAFRIKCDEIDFVYESNFCIFLSKVWHFKEYSHFRLDHIKWTCMFRLGKSYFN